MLITVGGGCSKPLIRTYGAQQYQPTEVKSIALFFNLYYFVFNCGTITSRFISPILRREVKCFGNDDCFPLAFGIPGIFMILVTVLTIAANRYSQTHQASGTTLLNVIAVIWVKLMGVAQYTSNNNRWPIVECNRHENQIEE